MMAMYSSTIMLITALSVSTMLTNNPMSLTLVIILMSMLMCLSINMKLSSWFAMILLLVFIGGMMIMFSYFTSFSSNDNMPTYNKLYVITIPTIMMKTMNMNKLEPLFNNQKIHKLYSPINTTMMLIITMVLLMMMVLITKMVKTYNAPLRGFNK